MIYFRPVPAERFAQNGEFKMRVMYDGQFWVVRLTPQYTANRRMQRKVGEAAKISRLG